ncbi:hypothetical protein CWE13_00325 [Aliidiomarina shirensis]|uniref:Uncharacterized protein n=1 Tax=Aliidiomarina shirensis TaxID=1048642 RepID=A0A432WWH9_9GAMM|nr:hypothetical protein [Aliidiomarina shirensis]RUO38134.1 hypothetical protein CWE13_00325 [Aliidiomarina shirensis]
MKKSLYSLALLITTAASPLTATANDDFKYPVYVSHSGDDSVGSRVAFNVRNLVRSSPHLKLSNDTNEPHFGFYLISTPLDSEYASSASAFSLVFTFDPGTNRYAERLLTAMVGRCGSSRVASCAEDYVANLDEEITKFERYFGSDIPYLFKGYD